MNRLNIKTRLLLLVGCLLALFVAAAVFGVLRMKAGNQSLAEVMAYPYWNMSYHQGQINYIASLLGCLD